MGGRAGSPPPVVGDGGRVAAGGRRRDQVDQLLAGVDLVLAGGAAVAQEGQRPARALRVEAVVADGRAARRTRPPAP